MESATSQSTWFVLTTNSGKFICCTALTDANLLIRHMQHECVDCDDVYEFMTPTGMQQNPADPRMVSVTKEAVMTPVDVVSSPTKMAFDLTGAHIMLFSSLSPTDRDTYNRLIKNAQAMAAQWQRTRSPIVLASTPTIG